jgi:hypothetical protein
MDGTAFRYAQFPIERSGEAVVQGGGREGSYIKYCFSAEEHSSFDCNIIRHAMLCQWDLLHISLLLKESLHMKPHTNLTLLKKDRGGGERGKTNLASGA